MNKFIFILGLIFTSTNISGMLGAYIETSTADTNKLKQNGISIVDASNQKKCFKNQRPGTYSVTFSGEERAIYDLKKAKQEGEKAKELEKIKRILKKTKLHPDKIKVKANDETLMVNAVKESNLELVKFLLDQGANPNQENRYGISILSLAYTNNDLDTMRLLLEQGIHPDNSTILGCSLLFIAYIENQLDTMKLLLQYEANPNKKGCFGSDSILIEAIQDKNFEMVELLLKYGADPNQTNIFGQTPALLAIKQRDSKITKLLFDYGGRLYFFKKN